MTNAEAKWMLSGSLLVILTVAIGVNSALFSQKGAESGEVASHSQENQRSIASINPIFKVSWEKKAFEVLEKTEARELSSVGKKPTAFDKFAFGDLEGKYQIRKLDGKITAVHFTEQDQSRPHSLLERDDFFKSHLALFSDEAHSIQKIHVENNEERVLERFQLLDQKGEGLGIVQVLLDKDQNLLSMTVQ